VYAIAKCVDCASERRKIALNPFLDASERSGRDKAARDPALI
jgi:hypothetical protein